MRLKELMTSNPATCGREEDLAVAATRMWENDCGALPVVDGGKPVGVVTDRDICMAATFRGQPMSEITVAEVMSQPAYVCSQSEDIEQGLEVMREHRIRRVPVIDSKKNLVGMVSLGDFALESKARPAKTGVPAFKDVVQAMQGICAPRNLPSPA